MIYPDNIGKGDSKELHLRALERVWIQGRLKMWGRWSGMESFGRAGNMFNRLLTSNKVTKAAITRALIQLKRRDASKKNCASICSTFWRKTKSSPAFCTDSEAAIMDR